MVLAAILGLLVFPAEAQDITPSTAGTTPMKKVYTARDLPSELHRICTCESNRGGSAPRHFSSDGTVKRGKINPQDIGACQINLKYHEAAAKGLGLNVFKESDNYEYALQLYKKQGNRPWNWSKSCWGK